MKFYDDDMDELFKKAGRDYPLKTEPKNWDAVRGALHPEEGGGDVSQKKNNWRRLLPLLFLLLVPAVYIFIDKDNISSNDNGSIEKTTAGNNTSVISQESVKADVPATTKKEWDVTKIPADRIINNKNKTNDLNITDLDPGSKAVRNNNSESELALWNNLPSRNNDVNTLHAPSEVIPLQLPVRSLDEPAGLATVPIADKKTKNRKGIYLGLIAAPDVSTIKGQKVKGIGYSAGAIVGYTINNRWQVEGGVLWSRKKYYTDGKYFDKKGPGIPDNVKLLWLDGGCEMFEFPVVARYYFSKKKNTFFGSAGLTSYLMKTEDYNYSAISGAGNYPYDGYKEYNRSGDHLFSNLQLSAGYNFRLSSKLNIRIEPYVKAPLKKIGIGKMPVTSTGLYFGITRDIR